MENTALNGTTITTKDHQGWKTKKGYGPSIIVAVSLVSLALLLGLSIYAGRHSDAMRLTNGVASSSSLSLVGSTASLSTTCPTTCKNDLDCWDNCFWQTRCTKGKCSM